MAPQPFRGQHGHGQTHFCNSLTPKPSIYTNILTDDHVHSARGSWITNRTEETLSSKTIARILNDSRAARQAPNHDHFDVIVNHGRFQVVHSGPPAGRGGGSGGRGGGRGGRRGARPPPPRRRVYDDDDGGCCIV